MITLDDAGLARLVIAATAVHPNDRGKFLERFARKAQPSAASRRQRAWRARRRNGLTVARVAIDDRVVTAIIVSRRLSDNDAMRPELVNQAAAAVLEEWAVRWLRD